MINCRLLKGQLKSDHYSHWYTLSREMMRVHSASIPGKFISHQPSCSLNLRIGHKKNDKKIKNLKKIECIQ